MIPDKLQKIMKQDGDVAIATLGPDGPHMVNTWNSYLKVSQDGRLFIPAGYMHKTDPSRLAQCQLKPQWRLAPAAGAERYATTCSTSPRSIARHHAGAHH